MADDSELDYIMTFIGKVNTTHTIASIETTKNINSINNTQSVLIYGGETLSVSGSIMKRQYHIQYKDATEGALNSSLYTLVEGIEKLNARETITDYTKPNSLVGMQFISTGLDYHSFTNGNWYANILITADWLTI